jgi:hypothetical protein
MIAMTALKVAAVSLAAAFVAYVALQIRIDALDGSEKRIGAVNGKWLISKHPVLIPFALTLTIARFIGVVALLVAAIAWAVGA